MVRKTVPSGDKRYVYYVCSGHPPVKRLHALVAFQGINPFLPGRLPRLDAVPLLFQGCNGSLDPICLLLVKDLSRLGRNYLEAGDYIEKIFPFFGA